MTDDLISRKEAIRVASIATFSINEVVMALDRMPGVKPEQKWIPIKFRDLTEEEKEEFDEELDKAFDCPLPDDGQEVLVSTKWGVDKDTFCIDGYGMYFENYDAEDVLAWMPLPLKYQGG